MDNGHDNNAPQPDAQQPLETPAQPDAPQFSAPQQVVPQAGTEQPAPQVNADQTVAPQGIFSSGDLAVHSENLDAIKPELSDENKSRIASAFAQTDATQKHDQLADQMADQDAISGTVLPAGSFGSNATASSASGDIRLPGRKKKSKLPLLVLAAVVVLAVVAGGVWWVMRNNGGDSGQTVTAKEAFLAYENYLKNGPEDLHGDHKRSENDEYFLFAITNNNIISEKEASDYLKELNNKYDNFTAKLGNVTQGFEEVNLDQYSRLLTLFIKSASLRELRQELLDRYLNSGPNSAYNYISEVTPKQPDNEEYYAMKKISGALEAYLNDELNLIGIYQDLGCIDDHTISAACGDEEGYTNSVFMELRAKQAGEQEIIVSYGEVLQPVFSAQTDKLSEAMEAYNDD